MSAGMRQHKRRATLPPNEQQKKPRTEQTAASISST